MGENYLNVRSQMKTGDVILWKTVSPIGWAIRMFSGGDFNHCSLVVDINGYDELVDRKFLMESVGSGVVLSSLRRVLKKHDGEAYWLPLKKEFDDKRMDIGNWAFQQVGIKYDYVGLFRQIFGKISANADLYFCSEFTYLAWKNVDIPMYNPGKLAPRPGDIPELGIFENAVII
jgi:hypothetical protein